MAPEVLIVGDATRRADLLARVEGLGYEVTVVGRSVLDHRVARGPIPGALIVCAEDVDARALMAALRGTRRGSGVPVTLYGPLGGAIDLADVLDLGADHFLEASAPDEALAAALEELLGPGGPPVVAVPAESRREPTGSAVGTSAREGSGGTDVVIGQLHRTLDALEARLREREDEGAEADDIDLDALGLPTVEEERDARGFLGAQPEPPASMDRPLARTESAQRREPIVRGRREPTERLAHADEPAEDTGAGSVEVSATSLGEDRPRRHAPLPIDDRGTLDRVEVPRLLWLLHRARFTGALSLEHGARRERLWWRDGELVHAAGDGAPERLIDELLRRGLLTRDREEAARKLVAEDPRHAGARLVQAGLLETTELPGAIRDHLVGTVGATFPWIDGQWELVPRESSESAGLLDTPVALILAEGVRRRLSSAQLAARIGDQSLCPRLRREVMVLGGPPQLAERLHLRPSEEAWLSRLDGTAPLSALSARAGTDEQELLALVYLLHVLEHLELLDEPLVSPPHADPIALHTARIRDRLQIAREGDYFAALGLPRDAERLEVRHAHAEVSRTFADAELEPSVRRDMRAELEELRDLLDEARDVLSDDGLRSAYLAYQDEP